MSIVDEIIEQQAAKYGQDEEVARKLIAWFNALEIGNEKIGDDAKVKLRIEYILERIKQKE